MFLQFIYIILVDIQLTELKPEANDAFVFKSRGWKNKNKITI